MNKTELASKLEETKQIYEASLYSLYKHVGMSIPPEDGQDTSSHRGDASLCGR